MSLGIYNTVKENENGYVEVTNSLKILKLSHLIEIIIYIFIFFNIFQLFLMKPL